MPSGVIRWLVECPIVRPVIVSSLGDSFGSALCFPLGGAATHLFESEMSSTCPGSLWVSCSQGQQHDQQDQEPTRIHDCDGVSEGVWRGGAGRLFKVAAVCTV